MNSDEPRDRLSGEARAWLRFADGDIELADGTTTLGRNPGCEIVLDDPMVSRQHARIIARQGTATIEDLGSVNGLLVNGERLVRARVLVSGDHITIGQQAMEVWMSAPVTHAPRRDRSAERTLTRFTEEDNEESTRRVSALELLGGVADKILALGRGDEAERMLSGVLRNLLQTARSAGHVDGPVAEAAASYAVRIAQATGKSAWIDYAFDLYGVARRPLPGPLVDTLYELLRRLPGVSLTGLREYLAVLRGVEASLGPSDRFLVRRLEGLEALLR